MQPTARSFVAALGAALALTAPGAVRASGATWFTPSIQIGIGLVGGPALGLGPRLAVFHELDLGTRGERRNYQQLFRVGGFGESLLWNFETLRLAGGLEAGAAPGVAVGWARRIHLESDATAEGPHAALVATPPPPFPNRTKPPHNVLLTLAVQGTLPFEGEGDVALVFGAGLPFWLDGPRPGPPVTVVIVD